jgi:hypothetical protein
MDIDTIRSGRQGIAYANGRWIAVTGGRRIITSTDGTNWATQDIPCVGNCYDIAYANGVWIAVGSDGSNGSIAISTDNGASWSTQTVGTNSWYGITYANGTWIALGYSGHIAISTDNGRNWTIKTAPGVNALSRIEIAYANDIWVAAVSYCVGGGCIFTSTDNGATWTRKDPYRILCNYAWCDIAYANGIWMIVGGKPGYTISDIATSTNGMDWQIQQAYHSANGQHIVYANGIWLVVGSNFVASANGRDWTSGRQIVSFEVPKVPYYYNKPALIYNSISHNNCRWIAVGTNNGIAVSVDNGATWVVGQVGTHTNWRGIAYHNGVWVAVGNNNGQWVADASVGHYINHYDWEKNNCIAISTDNGRNWTVKVVRNNGWIEPPRGFHHRPNYSLII